MAGQQPKQNARTLHEQQRTLFDLRGCVLGPTVLRLSQAGRLLACSPCRLSVPAQAGGGPSAGRAEGPAQPGPHLPLHQQLTDAHGGFPLTEAHESCPCTQQGSLDHPAVLALLLAGHTKQAQCTPCMPAYCWQEFSFPRNTFPPSWLRACPTLACQPIFSQLMPHHANSCMPAVPTHGGKPPPGYLCLFSGALLSPTDCSLHASTSVSTMLFYPPFNVTHASCLAALRHKPSLPVPLLSRCATMDPSAVC